MPVGAVRRRGDGQRCNRHVLWAAHDDDFSHFLALMAQPSNRLRVCDLGVLTPSDAEKDTLFLSSINQAVCRPIRPD